MTGPSDPGSMRAGNADRERVVRALNDAFAEGRLDVGELDERVSRAYAAKTLDQLGPLTADLPVPRHEVERTRGAAPQPGWPAREVEPGGEHRAWRRAVTGAVAVFLVNVLIWAVVSISTQSWIYFWPVWLLIPLVLTVARGFRPGRRDG
ncbi:MAG TPA: DUF1707 domain-containing protein [Mycobacteriales bacterium]|nr:DUF1707 domain-containing protein [Mycobacteriales bacterium]